MIKTLKSELKLRPTYDEMIGMIESQGDPNRPSIEQVIDRRATLFRNNQFGSQFDNLDFLGLKKQEEDKVKNDLRRAQLNHHGVMNGVSTAVAGMQTSGTTSGYDTPVEAYQSEDEGYPDHIRNLDDAFRRMKELEEERRKHIEDARSDLDDVHHQSLPAGVEVHSMDTPAQSNQGYPPSLPPPPPQEEEEDEEEDAGDLTNRFGLIGDFNPDKLYDDQNIKSTGLMFQLFVRGLLSDEMIELTDRLPNEEKKKRYLVSIIEGLKETDEWQQTGFSGKRVRQEVKKFRDMRRNIKNKPKTQEVTQEASSSSSPMRDIAVAGAKAGVEALAKAGATAIAKAVFPA